MIGRSVEASARTSLIGRARSNPFVRTSCRDQLIWGEMVEDGLLWQAGVQGER